MIQSLFFFSFFFFWDNDTDSFFVFCFFVLMEMIQTRWLVGLVCNVLKESASCKRRWNGVGNVGFGRKAKESYKANNYSTSTTTTRELHGFICPHAYGLYHLILCLWKEYINIYRKLFFLVWQLNIS